MLGRALGLLVGFSAAAALLAACSVSLNAGLFVQPQPGAILIGSSLGPTNQTVLNPTTSISREDHVTLVAEFSQPATGLITLEGQTGSDPPFDVLSQTAVGASRYLYATLSFGPTLVPGHYTFRVLSGSTVLAIGAIDITS